MRAYVKGLILGLFITFSGLSVPVQSQSVEFQPSIDTLFINGACCTPQLQWTLDTSTYYDTLRLKPAADWVSFSYDSAGQEKEIPHLDIIISDSADQNNYQIGLKTDTTANQDHTIPFDSTFSSDSQELIFTLNLYRDSFHVDSVSYRASQTYGLSINERNHPRETHLLDNYPTPFNPSTQIHFQLKYSTRIKLRVYDINGHLIKTIVDGFRDAGKHNVSFHADNLASGLYFYRLKTDQQTLTGKMLLIK